MTFQTFTTLDEVPEAQRESAIETKAGTFLVPEDLTPLKDTLAKERERADAAEKAANRTARELAKAQAEAKAKAAGLSDEQIAEMRAQARKDLEVEFSPLKERADLAETLAAENRALLLDNKVKAMMAAAGVRADRIEALFKVAGDRFDLTTDKTPMLKAAPTTAVEQYVKDTLKVEFPEFYEGSRAAGGNAPGSSGVPLVGGSPADLSPVERITRARQQGKAA